MKTCTVCKNDKDECDFAFKNKKKGALQAHCRECQTKGKRKYYEVNKSVIISRAKESNKVLMLRNMEYVHDYLKKHPCSCGETDPVVLEFDHRDPTQKVMEVSKMVYLKVSLERLQGEMNKCDVLCANCHRRKTAKQRGWYKLRQ